MPAGTEPSSAQLLVEELLRALLLAQRSYEARSSYAEIMMGSAPNSPALQEGRSPRPEATSKAGELAGPVHIPNAAQFGHSCPKTALFPSMTRVHADAHHHVPGMRLRWLPSAAGLASDSSSSLHLPKFLQQLFRFKRLGEQCVPDRWRYFV